MKQKVIEWIKNFVEVPHPDFGGMSPCPFSKRARERNRLNFIEFDGDESDLKTHIDKVDTNKHDMTLIICDKNKWTAKEAYLIGRELDEYSMLRGLTFAEDHPEMIEMVGDTVVNNGEFLIFYIVGYEDVKKKQKILSKTNYYETWNKDNNFDYENPSNIDSRQNAYNNLYGDLDGKNYNREDIS